MDFDRRHDFVNTWFLWTVLHTLGGTFGVLLGEILGHYTAQLWTPAAGHLAAFLVFELAVWLPRRMVFQRLAFDASWIRFTQISWLAAECIGWVIGTQLTQNTPNPHFADGATFGAMLSATMWFLLWCMHHAPYGRWWVVTAFLFAFAGFIVANAVVTVTLVFNSVLRDTFPQSPFTWIATALSGVLVGFAIGGLTGILVASQRTKTVLTSPAH